MMTSGMGGRSLAQARPELRLVHDASPSAPLEWQWFCGHCAAPSASNAPPLPTARVCPSCGMGLLLETPAVVAPARSDAFLVVDSRLLVQAVSEQAESLLSLSEGEAVNRPAVALLAPADAEAGQTSRFVAAVGEAVGGSDEPASVFVRPWNTFGVRMRARVAACGPPRAALVVLETAPRDLRAVTR